jgi:hypothetical protein
MRVNDMWVEEDEKLEKVNTRKNNGWKESPPKKKGMEFLNKQQK